MKMGIKCASRKINEIKQSFIKECEFINNIFSVLSVPSRMNEDNVDYVDDYVYVDKSKVTHQKGESIKRAINIDDLEQRLYSFKSNKKFTIKEKLIKKSLASKKKKMARKAERNQKERMNKGNNKQNNKFVSMEDNKEKTSMNLINQAKPVFNSEGKLVFSKFDFSSISKSVKKNKADKDPIKVLENLHEQDRKIKQLMESGEIEKAAEVKEKIAWKNALAKAEGQKVKDDALLLKKSAKKLEQKKKQSKKKWDERNNKVEQAKLEKQKKRNEHIQKKNKSRKSAKIKKSIKKGRVVI